jgi:hypothetical protein
MNLPLRRLLVAAALLAVGWAQAFGLHRGYLCDCAGGIHLTQVDHCHSAGSSDHHDHELPLDHDCPADQATHDHDPVVDDLVAQHLSSGKIQAPPLPLMDGVLAWHTATLFTALPNDLPEPGAWSQLRRCPRLPDWPRQLSQSISLRL